MGRRSALHRRHQPTTTAERTRSDLLTGIPVVERRLSLAGVSTALLEGGEGPPIILLHGPGEAAVNWRWVLPDLVTTHRVIAPDLPAHGSSDEGEAPLDEEQVIAWLDELIARTCTSPPVLVGHVLGGAIGARFAIDRGDRVARLVLVDSLGLSRFRPSARFAATFLGFTLRPTETSYTRFMDQCAFDLDALRDDMADDWPPFLAYNLALARSPKTKSAGRLFRKVGIPRIPSRDLARIGSPTALIWGRHDRATRLRVARSASERFGWPLHVVDDAADDPARDQPRAFLEALRSEL